MSDGTGAISYGYNQLSRMTSEMRTFTGLSNSYTISYSYNLGGELTNVIDPSGAQVSYNYDSTGRLTGMPASGYTGVSNFLSSVQYRAFGGMKHATYGNSVQVDLTYNSRMQIGQYQASGFHQNNGTLYSMGATMSYYNDGRTNTAFDLNNSTFDRKYEFDFSARLKEAYSGAEAHGQSANPGSRPYRQSYTYDEYNDVLTRSGMMWTQYDSENGSYTNDNKRQGWGYDNAGNALTTFDGTYTYDAASRPVSFASFQTWKAYPDWPSSPPDGPSLETQDTFDGTGQIAKHVNTTRLDETIDYGDGNYFYWLNENTTTTYYVHSTALGGKTIAEVASNGSLGDRFVYSGGARVGTYHAAGYTSIEATNPVTGAAITTDVNGSNPQRQEPDPLGRDLSQPPVSGVVSNPLGSANLKDRAMPIEASWGPSAYYEAGNAWWAGVVANHWAENAYMAIKHDFIIAVINQRFDQAAQILAKNPNFFIQLNGKMTAGKDAANAFMTALANLPGDPLGMKNAANDSISAGGVGTSGHAQDPKRSGPHILGNPDSLEAHSENCGLKVTFMSGTNPPNRPDLPNGPSTVSVPTGRNFGLGFTVLGWVHGGIGKIGDQANPQNPGGTWTMDQWTSRYFEVNGKASTEQWKRDINLDLRYSWTNGDDFSWYDNPSAPDNWEPVRLQNFTVSVSNGSATCAVSFHFSQNGHNIQWGPGLSP